MENANKIHHCSKFLSKLLGRALFSGKLALANSEKRGSGRCSPGQPALLENSWPAMYAITMHEEKRKKIGERGRNYECLPNSCRSFFPITTMAPCIVSAARPELGASLLLPAFSAKTPIIISQEFTCGIPKTENLTMPTTHGSVKISCSLSFRSWESLQTLSRFWGFLYM